MHQDIDANGRFSGHFWGSWDRLASLQYVDAAFPVKCLGHDLFQIVMLRPPAEIVSDLSGRSDDGRRISCPPRRQQNFEIDARNALNRRDDLDDRIALRVSAIEDIRCAAAPQIMQ